MTYLALGEQICKTAIWDRIEGWQVVLTVLFVLCAWTVVQWARLYYIAEASKHCPHCENDTPTKSTE